MSEADNVAHDEGQRRKVTRPLCNVTHQPDVCTDAGRSPGLHVIRQLVERPLILSRIRSMMPVGTPTTALSGGWSGAEGCGRVGATFFAAVTALPRSSSWSSG